jgi:hypothetical protein
MNAFMNYLKTSFSNQISQRTALIRISTALFLLMGICLSFQLWLSDRTFPLCPVGDWVPSTGSGLDLVMMIFLILLLLIGMFTQKRIFSASLILLLLFLFLQDQMRWQPWAYMYVLMIFPFAVYPHKKISLTYFQIIIIGVYLWGGIHKFSSDFIDNTYFLVLTEMFGIESKTIIEQLKWTGYFIPVIELAIAITLIFPNTRKWAIFGVFLTHLFILIFLISIDSNSILYPWNIAMVVFTSLLFYKNSTPLIILKDLPTVLRFLNVKVLLLFIVLPSLSLFGKWDNYLSFKLFSGKTHLFYIHVDEANLKHVNPNLKPYFWKPESLNNGVMISLNEWTLDEMNIPFYPETRVFKKFIKSFCQENNPADFYVFTEFERSFQKGPVNRFVCGDVE